MKGVAKIFIAFEPPSKPVSPLIYYIVALVVLLDLQHPFFLAQVKFLQAFDVNANPYSSFKPPHDFTNACDIYHPYRQMAPCGRFSESNISTKSGRCSG